MKMPIKNLPFLPLVTGLLAVLSTPAFATVTLTSFNPSHASPEPLGKTITWTATATDTNAGPLTFQFNVTPPNGPSAMVKDFNVGTLSGGVWTSPSFVWVPTAIEGKYQVQVVVKDFASGQTTSKTTTFQINPIVTGSTPVVEKTANPLVALFSAPACAAGSYMRASFQVASGKAPASLTNWMGCHSPATMTFELAGMYPSTEYTLFAQTKTGSKITNGSSISFTTGALPKTISFPKFGVKTASTDPSYPVILHNPITFGVGSVYPDVATDLSGRIIWYYEPNDTTKSDVLTRPLQGGGNITIQDDVAWNPNVTQEQFLRQIDLAGNIVRETNMGVIQQELLAKGAVNGGPCTGFTSPPPVGAACAGSFHHDAIQTLPNGWTAALLDIERIFPAGTQGDTSGLLVDIIGDMIIVMDTNWQVQWYWDSFDPAGGNNGYPLMPVSNPPLPWAPTCGINSAGCPPMFLLGSGIAPLAHDWLHANSLYYWPATQDGSTAGDIIWSSRHQDWFFRIDYKDGAGTGNILWRAGATNPAGLAGNFTISNPYNDPWIWWSGQHDVGIENSGTGPITLFDNGDSRIANPPLGLGSNCEPNDCSSRGMAINILTEPTGNCAVSCTPGTMAPVAIFDLGTSGQANGYSVAMGSAELLPNGNYFFENPIVFNTAQETTNGFSMEVGPVPAFPQAGTNTDVLMDVSGPEHYRGWQMVNLYSPPIT
jgi:arylsulfate sulfotransferase